MTSLRTINDPLVSKAQIYSQNTNASTQRYDAYPLTVQKSGTHLLKKILDLLEINWIQERKNLHLGGVYAEILNGKSYSQVIKKNRKYYILYRDPRDCVISQIFYKMKKEQAHSVKDWNKFPKYSMHQLINKTLRCHKAEEGKIGSHGCYLFRSIKFATIVKKRSTENQLIIRFEDLLPAHAGGPSEQKRFSVFKKICEHVGKEISDEKILDAMENCWGGTRTFRASSEKKVGQWKKYFSRSNILLFQKKYNRLLLDLGYETNPNWHLKYLKANS